MKLFIAVSLASFVTTVVSAADPVGYYSRTILVDDFSGSGFGPRWGGITRAAAW
ncbi:MAG: hypothetical protein RL514_3885 [Verrucomicrobiota bacterium]|jgi:hypothetical protein